jgi:hypothetical protein
LGADSQASDEDASTSLSAHCFRRRHSNVEFNFLGASLDYPDPFANGCSDALRNLPERFGYERLQIHRGTFRRLRTLSRIWHGPTPTQLGLSALACSALRPFLFHRSDLRNCGLAGQVNQGFAG